MTTKVTKESLTARISYLEMIMSFDCKLTLKEEYQLEAYKMLLALLEKEDDKR